LKSTLLFFIITFSPRTLSELHPPHSWSAASPLGRVASLQLSLVLGCVALLLSYSSPLPHGGSPPLSGVFPCQWVGRSFRLSSKWWPQWSCCLISHSLLASSIGTVGFSKGRDPVTVLPPSHFLGCLLSCPVSRSRRSVTAIYTLVGGIRCHPLPSPSTSPWWHLGGPVLSRLALASEVMFGVRHGVFGATAFPLAILWVSLWVAFIFPLFGLVHG